MKVEKISENKVKITLSMSELSERNISLIDIEKDASKAKNIFLDLIAESNLESSFILDHSQLLVEATTDYNDFFTITITKMDDLIDINKFSLLDQILENKKIDRSVVKSNITKTNIFNNFNIFCFSCIDKLLEMSDVLKKYSLYLGKSNLYITEKGYFLVFSRYSIKNIKFSRALSIVNEYCDSSFSSEIYEISLKEKGKLIIKNKALQILTKI